MSVRPPHIVDITKSRSALTSRHPKIRTMTGRCAVNATWKPRTLWRPKTGPTKVGGFGKLCCLIRSLWKPQGIKLIREGLVQIVNVPNVDSSNGTTTTREEVQVRAQVRQAHLGDEQEEEEGQVGDQEVS